MNWVDKINKNNIMPDISMCDNNICPSKEECYRFKAIPNDYQTYTSFIVKENEDKCDDFMKINKYNLIRKDDKI